MADVHNNPGVVAQMLALLRVTGAKPSRWIVTTVIASVILAALDLVGVAAMIPLMQLVTSSGPLEGANRLIADLLGTTDLQVLIPVVAGGVALAFVFKSAGSLLFRWWLLGRTTRLSALASVELMRRYVLAPYGQHRQRSLSTVYRNINDATNQSASVLLAGLTLFTDALVLTAIVAVLLVSSPGVTIFAVALFGLLVFGVQHVLRRRQLRIGENLAEAGLRAWQSLMPGLDGFRETRLTGSADRFIDGYRRAKLDGAHQSRLMAVLSDIPRYLLEVSFILAIVGIAVLLFATGQADQVLPVLGLFAAASMRALPTLNRITANVGTMRAGRAGLRIFTEALAELESDGVHDARATVGAPYRGDIELDHVTFQYADADRPVLDGLSLRIPANETTAFVGSSGAGKSTLLDLILGLLSPTSGTICCGGRPIDEDLATWYSGLGVVPQEVFLSDDTVAANIAFGIAPKDIDPDRMREVASVAQLDALIADLPHGFDTMVGDRGVRLSGGQRQRIGLARALYRRPRVLVLDEATSALDNATEHEIATTLDRLRGSMTVLIVAHRLSTVRNADTLIFLESGRIATRGTFDEVRQANEEFARLVELGKLE
ncbi:ABC transporter ATP-binding protein [Microbacterium sp. 2216-1]|uniref:ABC transporter ATP-binding protein n=1 Tax=Microbacterium sp. 2216-1 TaxID=3390053 RepID=UPI003974FED7